MSAACLTVKEMRACVVKAGISKQKETPCIFCLFCICIYMLWTVVCESKDEAYLVVQVSLYNRSNNSYKTLPHLYSLYLNTGVFQMERKKIREGKSLNGGVKASFPPLPEFPNTWIVQW